MKKIYLLLTTLVLTVVSAGAQDLAQATEAYNNGAMALQNGDNASAIDQFNMALAMAETLGEEGLEIANNCKNYIPKIMLSMAKDCIKDENYTGAVEQLEATIAKATEYADAETAEDAKAFIPQVFMQKGNSALKAKDFANAVAAYQELIAIDPTNGNAYLRLGQALGASGKAADAIAAFQNAALNGEEKTANKQISNIYNKQAAAALKGKQYQKAIDAALKAFEALENPISMKVAGTAASQLQKSDEAIKYLETYLELSPNAKDASQMIYTIAALAQTKGDKAKAKEYYQKIITDPKFGATAQQMLQAL